MFARPWKRESRNLCKELSSFAGGLLPFHHVRDKTIFGFEKTVAEFAPLTGSSIVLNSTSAFDSRRISLESRLKLVCSKSYGISQSFKLSRRKNFTTQKLLRSSLCQTEPTSQCRRVSGRFSVLDSRGTSIQFGAWMGRCLSGDCDDRETEEQRATSCIDGDDGINRVVTHGTGQEELSGHKEQVQAVKETSGKQPVDDSTEEVLSNETDAEALFCSQKAAFRKDFEKRIVAWEDIGVDLLDFPYYLSQHTRDMLIECVGAQLRQPRLAAYGSGLPSSSRRVMIRGPPGTELYQEKLVQALAHYLRASLLVLESTSLAPHDYGDEESTSEAEEEESQDSQNEQFWSGAESKWTNDPNIDSDDEGVEESDKEKQKSVVTLLAVSADNAEALRRKLSQVHNQNARAHGTEQHPDSYASESDYSLRKGDRVKYVGSNKMSTEYATRKNLKMGQRGRVVSIPKFMTGKVGVKFEVVETDAGDYSQDREGRSNTERAENFIDWCDLSDLEPDDEPAAPCRDEWFAAVEALCEVASTEKPLIIYLPDPRQWFYRSVSMDDAQRHHFLLQVEHKFEKLRGPVVVIAGRVDEEDMDVMKRLKANLEYVRHRLRMKPSPTWTLKDLFGSDDIYELFVNTVNIHPPQDENMRQTWNQQLIVHKEISQAKWNQRQLQKVLQLHNMECIELSKMSIHGLQLTNIKAEIVVGWARNHLLGSCMSIPPTNNGKLMIPRDSLERALTRLRDFDDNEPRPIAKDFKTVAEDEYEKALVSAVIPPNEVGVKFDHIGSLENVKQALRELVMLPLQRPELFSKGNLTRPCKGVLLFGPPGTGKTLLAKAVATEAGANFINITGSTITSKWFGDAEKLTKALFSLARKLSPAVIFIDEVDSLLGARGGSSEHEATRKTRNEFMAGWDGLRSKDNERVLVLAATNRPFDLDDAVIRRLPRRILVDLPNAENRAKILRVILAEEELSKGFDYDELAHITEGYSGSDLKNLSVAAAYRPIRELLDLEQKAKSGRNYSSSGASVSQTGGSGSTSTVRALHLDDFKEAMSQVGASISYDASSMNELRRWNEQYGEGGKRRRSTFGFAM